jgi:hypothetical protein
MAAPTDGAAAPARVACPVCSEPLEGRPQRCFRCETRLSAWWGFEEALGQAAGGVTTLAPAPARHTGVPPLIAAGVVAAEVLFFAWVVLRDPGQGAPRPTARPRGAPRTASAPASRPPAPPPARPAGEAGSSDPGPAPIRYRVQPGDSLSRIAASLTGDARRWRELWPERASGDTRIRAGTVLEVDLGRLHAPPPR